MEEKKPKRGYEKHLVPCPNCGRDILDHMTQCAFCKADVPSAYQPMDSEKLKKVRLYLSIIFCILAAILLLFVKCGRAL